MMNRLLSPRLDVVFKSLFADPANNGLLTDFLAAVLDVPIGEIKNVAVINGEITPKSLEEKFVRLDLTIEIDGAKIDVEMQLLGSEFYKDRALYYWAMLFTSGFKKGADYSELQKTISINVVNFNMFGYDDYHSVFELRERNHSEVLLTDKCRVDFLELKKAKDTGDIQMKRLERWMKFLNITTMEDADMVARVDNTMEQAVYCLKRMSADSQMQEMARIRERQMHDEASYMREAHEKGRSEGLAQGMAKGRMNIIIKMLNMGESDEKIMLYGEISSEELEKLRREYKSEK